MVKNCVLLLCCCVVSFLHAGKLEKGFEALNKYDYFRAKKTFEKTLKKQISPSAYGLAQIYFRTDNPFHSLDSALRYIQLSEGGYGGLKEKTKEKYKELHFDYIAIIELRAQISTKHYERAKHTGSLAIYDAFIIQNPWANEIFMATYSRDSIAYEGARIKNQSQDFKVFMELYPSSSFLTAATDQYYRLQYQEATQSNKLADYLEFEAKYPTNPYISEAENRIYELVTEPGSIDAFYSFIQNYPKNRNIGIAWKKVYQLFMIDFSDDRVERFLETYPLYPYREELQQDLSILKLKLIPFKKENLYGYMDYAGKIVIQPEYEQLGFFKEGLAWAVKDQLYGYVDKGNRVVIPFQFSAAGDFENGRTIVEKDGKFGMIDRAGNFVFPLVYSDLGQLSDGLIYASRDSLYGYYDKNNILRVAPKFEEAFPFVNGKAKVQVMGKQAFIDPYGSFVVPPAFASIEFFSDSLLIFEENEFFGLMRKNGEVVVPAEYDHIGKLAFNRAILEKDGKVGYLDHTGKLVIPIVYETFPNHIDRGQFKSNFCIVRQKGKFGVIDNNGKIIIPINNTDLGDLSQQISFSKGGLWGFMDIMGKVLMVPTYDYASSFKDSIAIVEKLTQLGAINWKGEIVIPIQYSEIERLTTDLFLVSNGAHNGIMDRFGTELVPMNYQQIRILDKDFLLLIGNNEVHYFYLPEKKVIMPIME